MRILTFVRKAYCLAIELKANHFTIEGLSSIPFKLDDNHIYILDFSAHSGRGVIAATLRVNTSCVLSSISSTDNVVDHQLKEVGKRPRHLG